MSWKLTFPEGKQKALTFSYDDAQIYDRKLVAMFDHYHLKGTFHLNSGTLSTPGFIEKQEVSDLYYNHEVACHGVDHIYLTHATREQIVQEIWNDRRTLEDLVSYPVRGLSYAFGEYSDSIIQILQSLGIEYSRTAGATGVFTLPTDYLRWTGTCHHNANLMELAEAFLNPPRYRSLQLFYIWGHSYEFEQDDTWGKMGDFCAYISNRDDIWYVTNIQYARYCHAGASLVLNVENTGLYNPSSIAIWGELDGRLIAVQPGQTVFAK